MKKLTAGFCAIALAAVPTAQAMAAPSIGTSGPKDPVVEEGTLDLKDGAKLVIKEVTPDLYKDKEVADVVKNFNDEEKLTSVMEVNNSLQLKLSDVQAEAPELAEGETIVVKDQGRVEYENKDVETAVKAFNEKFSTFEIHISKDGEEKTYVSTAKSLADFVKDLKEALADAGVEADEVLEVVMVGGSTRVPLVRERVGEFFGRPPLTSIDPDKVVAIGAAIQADILVGNKPDSEMLLLDVIPLSLGLETMGGLVEKVIPRNTTIPVARAQDFTTFKDGQTAMYIHVMQGERELVQDCRSLARFALRGIPALPAGGAHIRVTFQVDADGLLSVTAMEKSTGVEASIQVKPSYGLTDSEIASMIKDSMSYAEQDVKARMLAEQKVEAARVLESLHGALAADAALLSAAERQVIDDAAAHLSEVAQGDDVDAIEQAIKNVDKQTQDFAARRMDQSVRRALKGHSVDEV